jgi:membrane protease YdiL (CAAX protease family)
MNDAASTIAPWRGTLRNSRLLFAIEIAIVVAIFVADGYGLIVFSKTPYLLVLAILSLWLRGVRWRDIGLRFDSGWARLLLIGIAAGVAMEALELFVTQPFLTKLTGKLPDLSDFRDVVGNARLVAIYIALSWVLAGLGEELVWRGYLMNRVAGFFAYGRTGWIASLILVNIAFGLAHSYQDVTGIVENVIDGMLLGLLYLACGRNLIVPIVAHGMTDTLDMLIIYSGHYPGM